MSLSRVTHTNARVASFIRKLPVGFDFIVTTMGNSMMPTIRRGDTVLLKRARIEMARVGSVVAFMQPRTSFLVAHRVVKRKTVDGSVRLQTKGDANSDCDPWAVDENNFLGKAVWVKRGGLRLKLASYQQSRLQVLADKLVDVFGTLIGRFVV